MLMVDRLCVRIHYVLIYYKGGELKVTVIAAADAAAVYYIIFDSLPPNIILFNIMYTRACILAMLMIIIVH